jgi:hypothetical protein
MKLYMRLPSARKRWSLLVPGFNITIRILDIIHPPLFRFNSNISETGFCLSLFVKLTPFGPLDKPSLCLRNVVFKIKDRTIDNVQNCDNYINILSSQAYRCINLLGL